MQHLLCDQPSHVKSFKVSWKLSCDLCTPSVAGSPGDGSHCLYCGRKTGHPLCLRCYRHESGRPLRQEELAAAAVAFGAGTLNAQGKVDFVKQETFRATDVGEGSLERDCDFVGRHKMTDWAHPDICLRRVIGDKLHVFIVETDEFAHSGYNPCTDGARYNHLFLNDQAGGAWSIVVLRFNPGRIEDLREVAQQAFEFQNAGPSPVFRRQILYLNFPEDNKHYAAMSEQELTAAVGAFSDCGVRCVLRVKFDLATVVFRYRLSAPPRRPRSENSGNVIRRHWADDRPAGGGCGAYGTGIGDLGFGTSVQLGGN
jgi:hypothetical protein